MRVTKLDLHAGRGPFWYILLTELAAVLGALAEPLAESAAPLVDEGGHGRTVVALELGVVQIVVLVGLGKGKG